VPKRYDGGNDRCNQTIESYSHLYLHIHFFPDLSIFSVNIALLPSAVNLIRMLFY
jgi:hypothetical protein